MGVITKRDSPMKVSILQSKVYNYIKLERGKIIASAKASSLKKENTKISYMFIESGIEKIGLGRIGHSP